MYQTKQLTRHMGKKITRKNAAEEPFQRKEQEHCEAQVLVMPTEKSMYILDAFVQTHW